MATKTAKRNGSAKRNGTAVQNGTPKAVVDSDILTLVEAAAFLRVRESSLQSEAVGGRVPGQVILGEWRFSKSALAEWLKTPAKPRRPGRKEAVLALAGLWKDDPSVDAMMEEIDRLRGERPTEDEA